MQSPQPSESRGGTSEVPWRRGAVIGGYELFANLGTGRLTDVWLARTPAEGSNGTVVLKLLLPQHERRTLLRAAFVRELRQAATLSRPNIATVQDVRQADGHAFAAVELVPGRSLWEIQRVLFARHLAVAPWIAVQLAAAVCDGLAYAHGPQRPEGGWPGVVHRDLRPPRIMVSFTGAVKILGFGEGETLALVVAPGDASQDTYIAPEPRGSVAPAEPRADIYAVGVLLCEMLTGCHPSLTRPCLAQLNGKATDAPKPVLRALSKLSPALQRIVARATARSPAQRYASAVEMRTELREYLATAPSRRDGEEVAAFVRGFAPLVEHTGRTADAAPRAPVARRPPLPRPPALARSAPARAGAQPLKVATAAEGARAVELACAAAVAHPEPDAPPDAVAQAVEVARPAAASPAAAPAADPVAPAMAAACAAAAAPSRGGPGGRPGRAGDGGGVRGGFPT
jgi:serine/threonine-protein kinase